MTRLEAMTSYYTSVFHAMLRAANGKCTYTIEENELVVRYNHGIVESISIAQSLDRPENYGVAYCHVIAGKDFGPTVLW